MRGETRRILCRPCPYPVFNPLAPCGARPVFPRSPTRSAGFFNPLAPCGARRADSIRDSWHDWIFNPLAPCGARLQPRWAIRWTSDFQSTRPLRGETWHLRHIRFQHPVFNPLAPCGARHVSSRVQTGAYNFSIHSPLAGRDRAKPDDVSCADSFSIHSPLAGRDTARAASSSRRRIFNPLAPCGARPCWG